MTDHLITFTVYLLLSWDYTLEDVSLHLQWDSKGRWAALYLEIAEHLTGINILNSALLERKRYSHTDTFRLLVILWLQNSSITKSRMNFWQMSWFMEKFLGINHCSCGALLREETFWWDSSGLGNYFKSGQKCPWFNTAEVMIAFPSLVPGSSCWLPWDFLANLAKTTAVSRTLKILWKAGCKCSLELHLRYIDDCYLDCFNTQCIVWMKLPKLNQVEPNVQDKP